MSSSELPQIIARADHGISRRQMSANAVKVLYKLREAGFQGFLVGGAVRDLLLGADPKDYDVATDATPEQVKRVFRNCRLIGRRFRLAHVLFGPEVVEVATFRGHHDEGDREVVDGRILRDNVWGTLEEDAVRRDFTVNALYYGIEDFAVRDFVGGYQDIKARQLRLIGDPEQRYREDPVRMLRAARLAAKLDFSIEAGTLAPIKSLAVLLEEAAPARLFDECLKLFLTGHALASFRWLDRLGLFAALFPETARALIGDAGVGVRAMLEASLANTDARIAEGKPVTPAFLFAALLWEPVRRRALQIVGEGRPLTIEAVDQASFELVPRQTRRIALPRRFSVPMQEIWLLQPRFGVLTRRRAQRLLAHPRMRAAFDFLGMRAHQEPELAELFAWWEEAQGGSPEARPEPEEQGPTPRKRRRRRRAGGESAQE